MSEGGLSPGSRGRPRRVAIACRCSARALWAHTVTLAEPKRTNDQNAPLVATAHRAKPPGSSTPSAVAQAAPRVDGASVMLDHPRPRAAARAEPSTASHDVPIGLSTLAAVSKREVLRPALRSTLQGRR